VVEPSQRIPQQTVTSERGNKMKLLSVAILTCLLGNFSVAYSQSVDLELPITVEGQRIGTLTPLEFGPDQADPSRLAVRLRASFNDFSNTLDQVLRARGNFGSCAHRAYWKGATSVIGTTAELRLRSSLQYQSWACIKVLGKRIKNRNFTWTRSVDWTFRIRPTSLTNITAEIVLDDINGFPDWLEDRIGYFGRSFRFPVPNECGECLCSDIQNITDARLDRIVFSEAGNSIEVELRFSIATTNLTGLLRCF